MIRILLASRSGLIGDAICAALADQQDMILVGHARTVEEVDLLLPHCNFLLLTAQFDDVDIPDLIQHARAHSPGVKTVIVGAEDDTDIIVGYLEAGAAGYVLHREPVAQLLQKLRAAQQDQALVSPTVAAELMSRLAELAQTPAQVREIQLKVENYPRLTPREKEVLGLVAKKYINSEIGVELFISPGTVKNHLHRILKKLEVTGRDEAAEVHRLHLQQTAAAQQTELPTASARLPSARPQSVPV